MDNRQAVVNQAVKFAREQVESGKWNWEQAFNFVASTNNMADEVEQPMVVENVGWDG